MSSRTLIIGTLVLAAHLVSGVVIISRKVHPDTADCSSNPAIVVNKYWGVDGICGIDPGQNPTSWYVDCAKGGQILYDDAECQGKETQFLYEGFNVCTPDTAASFNLACETFPDEETVTVRTGEDCDGDELQLPWTDPSVFAFNKCYILDYALSVVSFKFTSKDSAGVTLTSYADTELCDNTGTSEDISYNVCNTQGQQSMGSHFGYFDVQQTTVTPTRAPTSTPTISPLVQLVFLQEYSGTTPCGGDPKISPLGQSEVCVDLTTSSLLFDCATNSVKSFSGGACGVDLQYYVQNPFNECTQLGQTTSLKTECHSFPIEDVFEVDAGLTCDTAGQVKGEVDDEDSIISTPLAMGVCYYFKGFGIKLSHDGTVGLTATAFEDKACNGGSLGELKVLFNTCTVGFGQAFKVTYSVPLPTAGPVAGSAPTSAAGVMELSLGVLSVMVGAFVVTSMA